MMEFKILPPGGGDESYKPVRLAVFVDEQGVPLAEEFDAADRETAWHVVCFEDGVPVATGRYINLGGGVFRLGRIAVRQSHRGTGLGRRLMEVMMAGAEKAGARKMEISAQVQAIGFYEKLGFALCPGEEYDDCGIQHRDMCK